MAQVAVASAEQKLFTFPVEIWLKIFKNCSYFELKNLEAASEIFKQILGHEDYDPLLFRTPPKSTRGLIKDMSSKKPNSSITSVPFELHPVLQHFSSIMEHKLSRTTSAPHLISRSDLPSDIATLYAEQAVWPPTRNIHIHLGREVIHFARGTETGLTVGQVMEALGDSDKKLRRRRSKMRRDNRVPWGFMLSIVKWELVRCSGKKRVFLRAVWTKDEEWGTKH